MAVVNNGMYVNRPIEEYIIGIEQSRDLFTPSYFHPFLIPPEKTGLDKYVWKYMRPLREKYENCIEIREKCIKCPGSRFEYGNGGRERHAIDNPTVLIEASEDFTIQFQNTILFVKLMICLYLFVIILKILLVMSSSRVNKY